MSSLPLAASVLPGELLGFIFWLVAIVLLLVGVAFDVLGCLGLVRLPDVYNRLQAATKCVTLGTCSILLGTAFYMGGGTAVKSLLCLMFVLVSSPVAAHAIARGAHRAGIRMWDGSVGDEYLEDKSRRGEE